MLMCRSVTGAMNRPGGVWFHPGFNRQLDAFELPVLPPESVFGPGPRSRPDARAFLGEWPCAVLPGGGKPGRRVAGCCQPDVVGAGGEPGCDARPLSHASA